MSDDTLSKVKNAGKSAGVKQVVSPYLSETGTGNKRDKSKLVTMGGKFDEKEVQIVEYIKQMLGEDNNSKAIRWAIARVWDVYGPKIELAAKKREIIDDFMDPKRFVVNGGDADFKACKIGKNTIKEISNYESEEEDLITTINGIPISRKVLTIINKVLSGSFESDTIVSIVSQVYPDKDYVDCGIIAGAHTVYLFEEGIIAEIETKGKKKAKCYEFVEDLKI